MSLLDGDFFSTPDQGMLNMPGGPGTPFNGPNALAWLRARGWSDPAAAGLVGGFTQESSLRPNVWGDKGMSYGIGQWNRGRLNALRSFGGDPSDPWTQLAFANSELQPGGPESKAGDAFRAARTANDAVIADRMYERPSANDFGKRLNYTNALMSGELPAEGAGIGKSWGKSTGEPDDMNPNIAEATASMFPGSLNPISSAQAADNPPKSGPLGNEVTMNLSPPPPAPPPAAAPAPVPPAPPAAAPAPGAPTPITPPAATPPAPTPAPLPTQAGINPNQTMQMSPQKMSPVPQPAPQPATSGRGAPSGDGMPANFAQYMREAMGGGDGGGFGGGGLMNRAGMALMALGTNGGGPAAQNLMNMVMQERQMEREMAMRNYPQMMAYKALISNGMDPNQAMIRAWAPQAAGQWEPKDIQTGSGMPKTIWVNSALGKAYDSQSGQFLDFSQLGGPPGAGGSPSGAPGGAAPGGAAPTGSPFGGANNFVDENGNYLMGDDLKKALEKDPVWGQYSHLIEGIADYSAKPGDVTSMKSNLRPMAWEFAKRINPELSQSNYETVYKTDNEFRHGGPSSPAATILNGNTAIMHLGELSDSGEELNNFSSGIPGNTLANSIRNTLKDWSGTAQAQNNFNIIKQKYVEEVSKFYAGFTGGSVGEREDAIKQLSTARSMPELRAAAATNVRLIQGKVDELQTRYHTGTLGLKGDFPVLSPESQKVFEKIGIRAMNSDKSYDDLQKLAPSAPLPDYVLKANAAAKARVAGSNQAAAPAAVQGAVPNERYITAPNGHIQVARNGAWVDWTPGQ